jgi:hypothetical protein
MKERVLAPAPGLSASLAVDLTCGAYATAPSLAWGIRFGGQLDYLHGSPFLVDYELVAVRDGTRSGTYTPDQRWAEPDVEHAAELLRGVAKEPERARALTAERAGEIRWRYRPEAIAAAFHESVETALGGVRVPAGQRGRCESALTSERREHAVRRPDPFHRSESCIFLAR